MKKLNILAIIAVVGLLFAPAAVLGDPPGLPGELDVSVHVLSVYRFAGYTTATTDGEAGGLEGMNALCQNDFGDKARMCTSNEFISSSNLKFPSGPPAWHAWLNPSIEPIGVHYHEWPGGPKIQLFLLDASGASSSLTVDRPDATYFGYNCFQWTRRSVGNVLSRIGTAVSGIDQRISLGWSCDGEYYVTCCVPSK